MIEEYVCHNETYSHDNPKEKILNLAKKHYKETISNIESSGIQGFDYGKRWGEFVDRMRRAIPEFQSYSEALEFGQSKVNFTHRGGTTNCWMYEWQLKAEFPKFTKYIEELEDVSFFREGTTCEVNGVRKSNILFYYLRILLFCLTHLKDIEVIAEIGPGFGELARLWMINKVHTPKNYILIDAPESLFFADIFLSEVFGLESICYISTKDTTLDQIKKCKFILCPVQFINVLKEMPISLVINTGSMQEMSEDWVDFWMGWLDQFNVKFFYSLNHLRVVFPAACGVKYSRERVYR